MPLVLRNRELFYAGLLALTVLLPAPGFLLLAVSGRASQSLLARLLAPSTVGAMHASFVLLPALIAFFAISVPAAFRTLTRSRPPAAELARAAMLGLAVLAYVSGGGAGWGALVALVAVLGISALPAAPLLSRVAPWLAPRAALAASACWLGVVYYQIDLLYGAAPSYAIAPSLAVLAMALAVVALAVATARAAAAPTPAWLQATMTGWAAIVLALLAPRVGEIFAPPADAPVEVATGLIAALLGGFCAFAGRDRTEGAGSSGHGRASRSAAHSHRVDSSMENP
ncbi:MAG TPA: hypothetical protein VEC57_01205 [Candidatus Limnocylindrales bacterium]|nr:hypothetical protein [Candidatus Limnocylindrales bacterium]